MPPSLNNVTAIECGRGHVLALRSNGTVVAWGDNDSGQASVPAGLSNVVAVSGGAVHSLAVKADGTVVAWGANNFGQTKVPIGLSNVVAVSAGGNIFTAFSVALQSDGTVVAWGDNRTLQTAVPSGLSNVVAISASSFLHSLGLKSDGTVVAWGVGLLATNVPRGLSNVVAIAAGSGYSLALRADGTIVAWGDDFEGETRVPASARNVTAIAAGWFHNVAVTRSTPPPWPRVTSQPRNARKLVGDAVNFSVTATSAAPLSYRWQHHGQDLPMATNATLVLTNLQLSQWGDYGVVVSAGGLSVRSAPAFLSVIGRPLALPQSVEGLEDNEVVIELAGFDPSGLPLVSKVVSLPVNGHLFEQTGEGRRALVESVPALVASARLIYVPAPNANGPDAFLFTVENDLGESSPGEVAIDIRAVNDPPLAVARVSSPTALAANDREVFVMIAPDNSNAVVVLDGSLSTDIEQDALEYLWIVEGAAAPLATSVRATALVEIGVHSLVLQVFDGTASASTISALEVITPGEAVESLLAEVNSTDLPRERKRPLNASLKAAVASFDRGNLTSGLNQLSAFQHKVRAQIASRDEVLANTLIVAAQQIMAALSNQQSSILNDQSAIRRAAED